jgi:hypothetical protein
MRIIVLVLLSFCMSVSCQTKKQTAQTVTTKKSKIKNEPVKEEIKTDPIKDTQMAEVIEYETMSRGTYSKIIFQNDAINLYADRDNLKKSQAVTMAKEDLLTIRNLIKSINPEILPTLKAPSDARFFDHGNPPAEITKLVTKLVSFSEKKK